MSDKLTFKVPATIKRIQSMADRSYRLTVDTEREIEPLQAAELNAMLMTSGTLGFVTADTLVDELDKLEVPEEILEVNQKSFAERSRAIAFLRWKNKGEPDTFDNYWSRLKEQILDSLKKGLPPKE